MIVVVVMVVVVVVMVVVLLLSMFCLCYCLFCSSWCWWRQAVLMKALVPFTLLICLLRCFIYICVYTIGPPLASPGGLGL